MPTSPISGWSRVNISTATSLERDEHLFAAVVYPADHLRRFSAGAIANHRRLVRERERGGQPRLVVVTQLEHRLARGHAVAGLLVQDDARGQIDRVLFLVAAGAER